MHFLALLFFPHFLSRGKTKKESVGRYVRARESEGVSRYVREREKGRERERRERWAEFVAMASSLWQASASGIGGCSSWLSSSNWPLLPGLPDDIALLCLARLPRTVLLSLRGVSKAWRKALEHPEFYETRVRLGRTEEWLYVESWNAGTQKVSWFAFDRAQAKWRKLAPLPKKRGFPAEVFGRSSTVLDGRLFVVGGKAGITGPTLRDLFIYSPLSNRWSRGRSMINTRHSPLVSVLNGKLYVLGGFDCFNKPMIASECYHFDKDEWTSVESQGHPCLRAPSWYCHGWQPLWQGLLLHNKDFYCSYKMDDSRAAVKHYDPNTGKWELRKPTLKALLRYGLSTVLGGKLYTIDWAAGRVRTAGATGNDWIQVKGLEELPWVKIWMGNPQMVGVGNTLYVVKRGLQILGIELSAAETTQDWFEYVPAGSGVEKEEVISSQVLAT